MSGRWRSALAVFLSTVVVAVGVVVVVATSRGTPAAGPPPTSPRVTPTHSRSITSRVEEPPPDADRRLRLPAR